ncbi:hypothetical protein SAMN05216353_107102 [Halobacillus alkaliphilus]|uniref:Uncharacterized protein n=1 Tax=Halobacillus alkaliphilus TaxID=396056 RepID=A0A1I2L4W1_9BACI|nr:hypothetical protein [Halobacillus alkaliphilus]SFF73923.1 hypothetical protein SAMN05216353_107102 [Halobacillus alkaliphilus]
MIAEMYKRREKLAYSLIGALILILGGYLLWNQPETSQEWLEAAILLFPLIFMVIIAGTSHHKYNKVKDISIPESTGSLLEAEHVVWKADAGNLPRLMAFEKNGAYFGMLKTEKLSWWGHPIVFFQKSILSFIPSTYSFYTQDGEKLFSFRRNGFKETKVAIFDAAGNRSGTYIQEEFKSLLHVKGEFKDEENRPVLSVKTSGTSGDFSLSDHEGHRWAHFYNGRFPHEYTELFRDVDNDIVELSNELSLKNKRLLLAVISFLFMNRSLNG